MVVGRRNVNAAGGGRPVWADFAITGLIFWAVLLPLEYGGGTAVVLAAVVAAGALALLLLQRWWRRS